MKNIERENGFISSLDKETKKIYSKLSNLLHKMEPKSLYEPCAYVMNSGGKHLRGYLVLLTTKAVGGKYSQAYNAALSVEILHSFTLVHDDIMDNADMRRGKPSLHKKYDVNTAILAGDSLIAIAYKNLLKDCKNNTVNILNTFNQSVIDVCEGQSLDKEFETSEIVSIPEYLQMIKKKTGALIKMCCSIGAQIGDGTKEQIRALEKYGENLGLAFQLNDDLLDIVGDSKEFGKKVGGDLVEGKKTYLLLKVLEVANTRDKKEFQKIIKNNGVKWREINKYKELYKKYDIFEITAKEADKYTRRAINSLKGLPDSNEKEKLLWLANLLSKRNK
ncbi:MAG: polyprenyl synthetase family protein [Bacteroidota bacterium]